MKGGRNFPEKLIKVRIALFKYVNERNSCNVKALRGRIVNRIIGLPDAG
jgi:hypothetical protein